MNAGIIAKQMLVLFLIMMAGYAAFKKGIVSKEGAGSISSAIINIFNPCLIISGVLNKTITYSTAMVTENLVLVALFFVVLIILSRLFTRFMKLEPGEVNCYRLMMIFPNLHLPDNIPMFDVHVQMLPHDCHNRHQTVHRILRKLRYLQQYIRHHS